MCCKNASMCSFFQDFSRPRTPLGCPGPYLGNLEIPGFQDSKISRSPDSCWDILKSRDFKVSRIQDFKISRWPGVFWRTKISPRVFFSSLQNFLSCLRAFSSSLDFSLLQHYRLFSFIRIFSSSLDSSILLSCVRACSSSLNSSLLC